MLFYLLSLYVTYAQTVLAPHYRTFWAGQRAHGSLAVLYVSKVERNNPTRRAASRGGAVASCGAHHSNKKQKRRSVVGH